MEGKKEIADILTVVYQSFWFSLLLAVLFMFAFKYHSGFKDALKKWLTWFKTEKRFRRIFYLAFYTALGLFRTLFNCTINVNPLSDILGEWFPFKKSGGGLVINVNVIENCILLIPFVFLFFGLHVNGLNVGDG